MATNKLPEGSTWDKFILSNVTSDQTVTVTFAPDTNDDGIPDKYQTVTVTASSDGSGTVDPSKKKEVALGEDVTFTVTPGEGQALYQVKVGDAVKYTNTAETPFSGTYTLEDVTADTVVTFVFSVDTDGDGIPDASETWFTVTLNHDANTSISSNGKQDSVKVKIGQDCPIQFSAISGYAIDTVTVGDTSYINNGQTEAPNGTDWTGITLSNVQDNMTVSVTGAATVDGGNFIGSGTYSGNEGNAIINAQGATCTINDGTFTGHMNAVSNMDNGGGCKLTINGGTFTTDGFEASGAVYNGTGNTVTIEDGTFTTEGDSGSTLANRGTAIVNGGTFAGDNCNKQCYTVDSGQTATSGATMELGENVTVTGTFGAVRAVSGELTIKGGSYQVVDCSNHNKSDFYALYVASEKGAVEVNIEDGTFQSLSNDCVRCGNPGFDSSAVINISGGSFTAPSGKQAVAVGGTGEISITAGNFSSNVQDFISGSSSMEEQDDGRFVVATN